MHHNGNGVPGEGHGAATADPYDALADLFLGSGPAAPQRRTAASDTSDPGDERGSPAAPIECIVLGHLPVLGAPWAAQYARTLAQTTGAGVGVATLRGGHLTVEVVGAEADDPRQSIDPAEAVQRAAAMAARWLVRTDEEVGGLAAGPHIGAITLLTAGDQASIVGSYAAVKRLLENRGSEGKTIRLAIMGTAPETADGAYARLAEAVRSFAGRAVERAPGAQRIAASGPAAVLFSGPTTIDAAALVSLIAGAARATPPRPAAPVPAADHASVPAAPAASPLAETRPNASPGATQSLASLVSGLSPLEVRCPYAPEVELASGPALDGAGAGLHLLVRAGPGAMEGLAAAAAWAKTHAALLRAAGVPARQDAEAAQHIFVDDARRAVRLLGTAVRVHLLADAARPGLLCRPLN